MSDFLTRARETAEREGLVRIPPRMMALHGGATVDNMRFYRDYYIEGFTSAVSRLPSEEEIAAEMKRHHFEDNLLGNVTYDKWMSKCACGWESEEFRYPGESWDAHYAHSARAVRELIEKKMLGG